MKTFEAGNDAAPLNCCPIEEKNDKNARNDSTVVFCCCFFVVQRAWLQDVFTIGCKRVRAAAACTPIVSEHDSEISTV